MKMKHFAILPLLAGMLFGCAKDNSVNSGDYYPAGEKTYAAFNFDLSNSDNAYDDFNPESQPENDANDALIAPGDLYVLVFNATTKVLEYKAPVTEATHTALMTSGPKKIFVLANISKIQDYMETVDPSDLAAEGVAITNTYASLVVNTTTLNDFYNIAFCAGTPQAYDIAKYNEIDDLDDVERTFSVEPLYTLADEGTYGLPMSNHNGYTFNLKPGVTEEQAKTYTANPEKSGSEQYNRFQVELDYLGAKARLVANPSTFTQTIADISNLTYTVKNLAKYTSLVQNYVGAPQSIYHSMIYSPAVQAIFVQHFDQASSAVEPVIMTIDAAPFIYVPENTNANLLRGQSSFYALNVTYKPRNIVTKVTFNKLTDEVVITETKSWDDIYNVANAASEGISEYIGDVYVYVPTAIGRIPAGFYQSAQLLAEAVWMSENLKDINDEKDYPADILNLVAGKYKTFVDAQSWYRIDIGTGTSAFNMKYGVLRGNAYTATVNNITGPGVPTEGELFEEKPEDPGTPVLARTYINVTIVAAEWHDQLQFIEL